MKLSLVVCWAIFRYFCVFKPFKVISKQFKVIWNYSKLDFSLGPPFYLHLFNTKIPARAFLIQGPGLFTYRLLIIAPFNTPTVCIGMYIKEFELFLNDWAFIHFFLFLSFFVSTWHMTRTSRKKWNEHQWRNISPTILWQNLLSRDHLHKALRHA